MSEWSKRTLHTESWADHFDDDLIESFHPPDDLTAPLLMAQQGQSYPKEYREENDSQNVHVSSCCSNVVGYEVSEELQECIYRRLWLRWIILHLPARK